MQREQIQKLAIEAGFELKKQPSGVMDLNPYVYEFVELLFSESEELLLLRHLHDNVRGVNRYNGVSKQMLEKYFVEMIKAMHEVNDFNHRCEDY